MTRQKKSSARGSSTDPLVVVVGSGPSAILTSFILDGNIPYYDTSKYGAHPDQNLHKLLVPYQGISNDGNGKSLLDAVADNDILEYVMHSHQSIVSHGLPVNVLIDLLLSDDEYGYSSLATKQTRIRWEYSTPVFHHKVLTNDSVAGGQWVSSDHDCQSYKSLSYAEMMSLPQMSVTEFIGYPSEQEFCRPTREELANYYSSYVNSMGLSKNFMFNCLVTDIQSDGETFKVSYNDCDSTSQLFCDYVVLASGIFESPAKEMKKDRTAVVKGASDPIDFSLEGTQEITFPDNGPVLVIGSGVSAAEATSHVLEEGGEVYHIFRTASKSFIHLPAESHPEYALIHDLMLGRTCCSRYHALPDSTVVDLKLNGDVTIQLPSGATRSARLSQVVVRAGRAGSLKYIVESLSSVDRYTLKKVVGPDMALAPNVFVVGSLTGDTLVRYMYGSAFRVAGEIYRSVRSMFQGKEEELRGACVLAAAC